MSRVNSWFGSGASTKSVGRSARPITVRMSSGSSCTVTPPVSRVASSSAGISPIHACSSSENSAVTSSGRSRRLSSHSRAVGLGERLRQQLVQQQHLDPARAHQVDERVELLAGAPHPDHVVEQQVVAVGGGQALVREVRAVDHHGVQRPDLGGDSER